MNKVLIRGLQVCCKIGCEPEERLIAQTLLLDLSIRLTDNRAAKTGRLEDTVCYKTACENIRDLAAHTEWPLLEQFAEDITSLIFENFPAAQGVLLEVKKSIIPGTQSTGLEISREREGKK